MSSSILSLVVLFAMTSLVASADDTTFDVVSDDLSRTLYLNSTGLAYGVAIGAVVILVAAVGLYLYDYYYGTARTDPIPGYAADKYYQQYYQDQAQNGEYAYADQAQYYRYVTTNTTLKKLAFNKFRSRKHGKCSHSLHFTFLHAQKVVFETYLSIPGKWIRQTYC